MTPQQLIGYYQRQVSDRSGCGGTVFFACLLIVFLLTGCKTIEYVPVVEHHTEYVAKTDTFIQKDSVFCHDSVYIHSKGDTVWYERWKVEYRDRWKERIVTDTIIRSDSIPVPYPVEKKLNLWGRTKQNFGGYAILILVVAAAVAILRLKKILP